MNHKFRFEIVRRANGRFGWIFVRVQGRRRVLARSVRDYRSPEKVEDAIDKMSDAPVVDTTGAAEDPFPLPATRFRIVSGVVPLIVDDDFDDEDDEAAFSGQAVPVKAKASRAAAVGVAVPKLSPEPESKPKAKAKAKPRGKRSAARKSKPSSSRRRRAA